MGNALPIKRSRSSKRLAYPEFPNEHFLVCASYMIAQNADAAYLWNIKNNTIYSVSISNGRAFLDAATIAVTKGDMKKYYEKKQQE